MPPKAKAKGVAAKAKAKAAAAGKAKGRAKGVGKGGEALPKDALRPPRGPACGYEEMGALRLGGTGRSWRAYRSRGAGRQ